MAFHRTDELLPPLLSAEVDYWKHLDALVGDAGVCCSFLEWS